MIVVVDEGFYLRLPAMWAGSCLFLVQTIIVVAVCRNVVWVGQQVF